MAPRAPAAQTEKRRPKPEYWQERAASAIVADRDPRLTAGGRPDFGVRLTNQWVELRDFHGIIALLMFAEQ